MKLISNNFMLKQVGNEYMIIPVSNSNVNFSKIFNTNEVGAFIFNNLKDHTKEEVLDLLKREYDAPFDVLKSDLDEFINELKKRGIYSD